MKPALHRAALPRQGRRNAAFKLEAAVACAAGLGAAHVAGAAGAPGPAFRMPDEGESHGCTWMGFTASRSIWGDDLPQVQQDLTRIANVVAAFEPVNMLVPPAALTRAQRLRDRAGQRSRIQLLPARIDDLWLRDTGPVFTQRTGSRELRAVDFNFNGWGGKQAHGNDVLVARFIAEHTATPLLRSTLVLEGGGLEVDGQGGAIIKESCVLNPNRNPERTPH